MRKLIWLAGISAIVWTLVLGQPVYGVRYCAFGDGLVTETDRVEMVRQAVLKHVSDPVYKDEYYSEIQQDMERMFAAQKVCAAKNGDENCKFYNFPDGSVYGWSYEGDWLEGFLYIDFKNPKYSQSSFHISRPTCRFNGNIGG
jgi:hypothetical protein